MQRKYKGNTTQIHRKYKGNTRKYKGNTKEILSKYIGSTKEIQRKSKGNTKEIHRKYKGSTKEIQRKYKGKSAKTLRKPDENEDFCAPFAPIALKMIKKHYLEKVFATRILNVGKPYKTCRIPRFSKCKNALRKTL